MVHEPTMALLGGQHSSQCVMPTFKDNTKVFTVLQSTFARRKKKHVFNLILGQGLPSWCTNSQKKDVQNIEPPASTTKYKRLLHDYVTIWLRTTPMTTRPKQTSRKHRSNVIPPWIRATAPEIDWWGDLRFAIFLCLRKCVENLLRCCIL